MFDAWLGPRISGACVEEPRCTDGWSLGAGWLPENRPKEYDLPLGDPLGPARPASLGSSTAPRAHACTATPALLLRGPRESGMLGHILSHNVIFDVRLRIHANIRTAPRNCPSSVLRRRFMGQIHHGTPRYYYVIYTLWMCLRPLDLGLQEECFISCCDSDIREGGATQATQVNAPGSVRYQRGFKSGTWVTLTVPINSTEEGTPCIYWAGGHVSGSQAACIGNIVEPE